MIINYDPKTIENLSKFFNESIENNKNEKYIMFIFNDIYENVINIDEFYSKYVSLMKRFDLPFAFYPYYIHFNKALQRHISFPSPKMNIYINNERACSVVGQVSYGMLIIDVEKLNSISFKFNEKYNLCFYLQQLIMECYKNNLYYSKSSFIDVFESYNYVTSTFKVGHLINNDAFSAEKELFYKENKIEDENIQEFIDRLKIECQKIKEKETKDLNKISITI